MALSINEFETNSVWSCDPTAADSCLTSGEATLQRLGFSSNQTWQVGPRAGVAAGRAGSALCLAEGLPARTRWAGDCQAEPVLCVLPSAGCAGPHRAGLFVQPRRLPLPPLQEGAAPCPSWVPPPDHCACG